MCNKLEFILLITVILTNGTIGASIIVDNVPSEKLIIDTDGGGDDGNAILLILSSWLKKLSNFEVLAITCTYGNTEEKYVEKNVLEILTIAKTPMIPVYGGAEKPLITYAQSDHYFGIDGFGDFKFDQPITAKVDKSMHAAVALVKYVKKYPGELNIICLGPQTNVAMAVGLYPEFLSKIKKLYVMGGSVTGLGNLMPGKEFNFLMDPISAFINLNTLTDKPCHLFPWDTVITANISKAWRKDTLGVKNTDIIKFLNKAEAKALNDSSTIWSSADVMCAGIMLWPDLITKNVTHNVSPIMDGVGKGAVLVDYKDASNKFKNAQIIQAFNVPLFQERLLESFS